MRQRTGRGSRWPRAALVAAAAAATLALPARAEAASIGLVVSPTIATATRPVTVFVSGHVEQGGQVYVARQPAGVPCALTSQLRQIARRTVPPGAFAFSATFTPQEPGDLVVCAWVLVGDRLLPLTPVAFTSAQLVVRPLAARLDPLRDLSTRTGSELVVSQTGFALAPYTHLLVRIRPGVDRCETPQRERARQGSVVLAEQPVSAEFAVRLAFRPGREGPHRLCAFLVDPATGAAGVVQAPIVAVADGLAPAVTAVRSFATAGRPSRVWFTVFDGSPTSATVTVSRDGEPVASASAPASRGVGLRSARWTPPAGWSGTLRFCVEARDAGGNAGSACGTVILRTRWVCGEPSPARRAGRCETPETAPRGAGAGGFVRCGAHAGVTLTARWTSCANARALHRRWLRGAGVAGWTCSRALRQCVAPWPRESYFFWR